MNTNRIVAALLRDQLRLAAFAVGVLLAAGVAPAYAIAFTPFGPNGEGGDTNGQTLSVAPGGQAFEIDGFVNIGGLDLNGGAFGTSAQLSSDPLPAGLDYAFSTMLSADLTDLTMTYMFTNNTGAAIGDLKFLSFVDFEIDEAINTYFNELAATSGVLAAGQDFEADEPGFLFGDISDNLLLGSLDNTNAFPPAEDVSMALSFGVASLGVSDVFTIDMMISEDGDSLGTFAMTQTDPDSSATTEITYSGEATLTTAVPEPTTILLMALGLAGLGFTRRWLH